LLPTASFVMPTEISVVPTLLREFCSIRFREKRGSESEWRSSVGASVVTSPSFRKVSHSPEGVPQCLQRLQCSQRTSTRALDCWTCMEQLPALTSTGATQSKAESLRATGTDGTKKFPPNAGGAVQTVSFSVSSCKLGRFNSEQNPEATSCDDSTKKARILSEKDSGQKSGRHDLNVRPPAPKAGALPS
jgi:hypothetical protein